MLVKMLASIEKYGMLSRGGEVLVAVSGGADSVALLTSLCEIRDRMELEISAIHVNHNLRGEESDRDERFVVSLCEKLHVPLVVESVDIFSLCKKTGESTELCARKVRYNLFAKHAKEFIATAHTADDNAETVIYNLCRGTGIKGICGIPPVRDNIVRPLIDCTRQDILNYLHAIGQEYVTDSTNLGDEYTRNKIRHNIIPELLKINPSFPVAVSRASASAREDSELIETQAKNIFDDYIFSDGGELQLRLSVSGVPSALRKRIVCDYVGRIANEITLDSEHLSDIEKVISGKIRKTSLPGNLWFQKSKNGFTLVSSEKSEPFFYGFELNGGNAAFRNYNFSIVNQNLYKKLKNVNSLLFKFSIDYDKIVGKFVIRSRIDGDKYEPVGRGVTKTVRKLLCESDFTPAKKSQLFMLCDDEGIVFTNLFGIDERVKVTESSKTIIVIKKMED